MENKEMKTRDENKIEKIIFLVMLLILGLNLASAEANYSDASVYTNFTWNETHLNDNFTISSWVYLKGTGTMPIFYKPTAYTFQINSANQSQLKLNNGTTFSSTQTISQSQWTFLAVTYNGTSITLYINENKTTLPYSGGYYKPSNTFESLIGADYFNNFNGTIDEVTVLNKYLNDNEINLLYRSNLKKTGVGEWILSIIQSGLQVGSQYLYSLFVTDFSGRTDTTGIRTINGNSIPSFTSMIYTPNSTDSLDPSVSISVTTNISDPDSNFESAILQWKNSTDTSWRNETMANQTAKGTYTTLNGSLTLPSYEDNITFRVWANDSAGGVGTSSNYTLSSYYDCTWSVSPSSLEELIGFHEDKPLGNITLINTGDSQYSNNNCSIIFTPGYEGWSSSYTNLISTSDTDIWATNNRVFQYASSIMVNASSNQTLRINASFPSTTIPFTETPSIIITSSINDSISGDKTSSVSSTMIISPPNPLLFQEIGGDSEETINLIPQEINLIAYTRNLGYDPSNSINTTAHNVSLDWTIPSYLSGDITGNTSNFYEILNSSTKQYLNLTLNLTEDNLKEMVRGNYEFALASFGYENDSENYTLIVNSGNLTTLIDNKTLAFVCGTGSDSYSYDCGLARPASETTGGGGGGGSGTARSAVSVATSADFQLVRGKQNEVKIIFENSDANESLKDLVFSVSGKISKYLVISPKALSYLGPNEKMTLVLTINSPTYIELGKQELTITMNAKKGPSDYTDSKKITLEIHELDGNTAKKLLNETKQLLEKLNLVNLSSDYLSQLFNDSLLAMETFNYEAIRDNHKIIQTQVESAIKTLEIINNLENLIKIAKEKGIGVGDSERLIKLAKLSLGRLEFTQAYERALDAQSAYAFEVKGELAKIGYYLKAYPERISLGAFFLMLFSFGSYRIGKLHLIKKRIKSLKSEEKLINQLIGVVQNECFKKNKMSMDEYETAIEEYQKRLAKITGNLISLENQRIHALRFTGASKKLKRERDNILKLITVVQTDYLKKRTMEPQTYNLKLKSYNKRLGEIDEMIATIEAKRFFKKDKGGEL